MRARRRARPRSPPTRRCCAALGPRRAARRAARRLPRRAADLPQALAAVDLALWDRAGRRAGAPGRGAARRRTRPRGRRQRDARRRGPRGRGGRRRDAARARGLPLREGQGRAWATTPGASPPCARRWARTSRCGVDANGAWDAPPRRWPTLRGARARRARAGRGARARRRGAARGARPRRPCRVAMDETAAEPGAAGVGRRRRRVPEDRPLRRDLRAARDAAAARAAGARSTSPRRSTARWASRRACTPPPRSRRAAAGAAVRAGHARRLRGLSDVLPARRRRDRRALGAGAARLTRWARARVRPAARGGRSGVTPAAREPRLGHSGSGDAGRRHSRVASAALSSRSLRRSRAPADGTRRQVAGAHPTQAFA